MKGRSIEIYTDGGFVKHKKERVGALGFVILLDDKELCRYSRILRTDNDKKVTNNVAELTAIASALKWCCENINEPAVLYLNSDSQYCVNGLTEWVYNWIKKDWKNSAKKPVENKKLWQLILGFEKTLKLYDITVKYQWVRGHKDNINYNVVVDELCNKAIEKEKSKINETA